jgi:hypothetical protein
MTYAESLATLVRTAQAHGVAVEIEQPGGDDRALLDAVFGASLAGEIADAGYPGGIEVPFAAEDFYLYPLAELEQRQAGYRTDARTGEASPDWDADRHVIGDWAANPVSIGGDGALAYAMHGRGGWEYRPIAPDLAAFLDVLARWIEYYRGARGGKILDADYEVAPEVRGEVDNQVTTGLPEAEAGNFADFLLGTV